MLKLRKSLFLSACGVLLFAGSQLSHPYILPAQAQYSQTRPQQATQSQMQSQPAAMDANLTAGLQYLRANRFKEAIYYIDASLKTNPENPDAIYTLAVCKQRMGDKDRAMELYKKVIFAVPNKPAGNMAIDAMRALDPGWVQEHVKTVHVENGIVSTRNGMVRTNEGATISLGELKEGLNPRGQIRTPRMVPAATTPVPRNSTGTAAAITSSNDDLPNESRVRFERDKSDIVLNVYINNRPIEMVFDTGAPGICIGKSQLQAIGITPPSGPPDGTTGGSSNNNSVNAWRIRADVKVENIIRRNTEIIVLEHNSAAPLLGQTFFKDFDYTIDQSAGVIDFKLKGRQTAVDRNAYQVPFQFASEGNRIYVDVEINGHKKKAIFDTGNTACALSFSGKSQLTELGINIPIDARNESHSGVSGSGNTKVFPVRKVKLGPIERYDMDISVNDSESGAEAPLLGQPFWQGWQYKIDMQRRVIEFVRRG